MASFLVDRPAMVGKQRFKIASKGGNVLIRRTGSIIRARHNQQEAVSNLRSPKMHRHTIIAEENRPDWGDYKTVEHLFTEVAQFGFHIPEGNYLLLEVGPKNSFIYLGDGGMKGIERQVNVQTGDVSIETEGGEFLQWHSEGALDSVWWSCKDASIGPTLDLLDELLKTAGGAASGAVHLLHGKKPTALSGSEILRYARSNLGNIDFLVVDYDGFSLSWMSSASPGRERSDSKYGEVSTVYEKGNDAALGRVLEKTATPTIKKNVTDILSGIRQRRLPGQ